VSENAIVWTLRLSTTARLSRQDDLPGPGPVHVAAVSVVDALAAAATAAPGKSWIARHGPRRNAIVEELAIRQAGCTARCSAACRLRVQARAHTCEDETGDPSKRVSTLPGPYRTVNQLPNAPAVPEGGVQLARGAVNREIGRSYGHAP